MGIPSFLVSSSLQSVSKSISTPGSAGQISTNKKLIPMDGMFDKKGGSRRGDNTFAESLYVLCIRE